MSNGADWSERELSTLRTMWLGGYSAGLIAKELSGRSRSAVIGKVHRLDLPKRAQPSRARKRKVPKTKRPRRVTATMPRSRPRGLYRGATRQAWRDKARAPEPEGLARNLKLMELGSCQCRWPVSGEKAETLFCGAPTGDLTHSYCEHHEARSRSWRKRND